MSRTLQRGGTAALAALMVGSVIPSGASAEAGHRADFSLGLTSSAPAASTGLTISVRFKAPDDPEAKPPPVKGVVLDAPAGTRFDTTTVTRCEASDAELRARGLSACPSDSKVGFGGFSAITGFGPPVDPFVADNHVFNGPDQIIEVVTFKGTDRTAGFDRLTIDGSTLTAHPPTTPGGPPDGRTATRTIDFAIPARGAFITTPRQCPADGSWISRGHFTFEDGGTETVASRTPCRPSSSPTKAAKLSVSVRPRRVVAGESTRFSFRVRSRKASCRRGATIRFAGQRATTDAEGRAQISARLRRSGRRVVRVAKPGCRAGRAWVRVRRAGDRRAGDRAGRRQRNESSRRLG